jgi:hypothetical protein
MRKFSKIAESEESSLEFKGDKSGELSDDVENLDNVLDDNLSDEIKNSIVDGEWEIDSIVDISINPPKEQDIKEAIVVFYL